MQVKIVSACVVLVLFITGCSCTGGTLCPSPQLKELESMHILKTQGLDVKTSKVYIDNSLDMARNKLFIEAMVDAINNHTLWEDVYVTKANYIKKDVDYYTKKQPLFNNVIQQDVHDFYIAKITMDHYAMSGNHMFKTNISYRHEGLITASEKYPAKKYTAFMVDERSLEIKGFENEKEAVDLFLYIVDSTTKFGFNEKFGETIEKTFQSKNLEFLDPTRYFGGGALEFDPMLLDKEGRLVIKSVLDYYNPNC